MSRAFIKTQAAVLRTWDWSESSQVVTLFSRDLGKVAAVAKGARRLRNAFNAFDGPFEVGSTGEVVLAHRGEGLSTITERAVDFLPRRTFSTLERQSATIFVLEVTNLLTAEDDPDPEAYDLLRQTLARLERTNKIELVALAYAYRLLRRLGFLAAADRCVECGTPVGRGERHAFDVQQTGPVCSACARMSASTANLRLSGAALATLGRMVSRPMTDVDRLSARCAVIEELAALVGALVAAVTDRNLRTLRYLVKG